MKKFVYGILGVLAVLLVVNLIILISKGNEFEKEVLGHDDVEYITYFYQDGCGSCKSIESDVDDFEKNGTIPLYKYKITDYNDKDRKDLNIEYTPTIFHIKNGKIIGKYIGATDCVKLMKNFE